MREVTHQNSMAFSTKLLRKFLKFKIMEDNITFRGHTVEWKHVYELMKRAILQGESHSALMIGPRGCGKTTLINSVLHQLSQEMDLVSDAIVVKLNGLIHHDDKLALKSITAQMQLENAVGDRVFGTFAENLAFLLSCLQSGTDRRCKSMIFILEEFDMFCHSGRTQTLLYNLFDITHSKQAPMCVLGVTNRIDVMDLLEKRVKSRFSHRHILIFPNEDTAQGAVNKSPLDNYKELFVELLSVPVREKRKRGGKRKSTVNVEEMDIDGTQYSVPKATLLRCKVDPQEFSALDPSVAEDWNAHIRALAEDDKVVDTLEKLCYYTVNEQIFRNILFEVVSRLGPSQPHISASALALAVEGAVGSAHRLQLLHSLSVLELSLLIALLQAAEIFDAQPVNFEMVLHRYTKFANANSSTQTVPRPVILKAFEHLQSLEIIVPVRGEGGDTAASRVQKEYALYMLAVPLDDIREAVKTYNALPTEISHWLNNSVM